MFKEFKEFVSKGNVLDLAVGVVIGAAFGKIVTSFVDDILMPPIGKLSGGVDFANLFINLGTGHFATLAEAKAAAAPTLNYGLFINNVLSFLIIALAIFLVVKQVNRMRKPAAAPPPTKSCPYCTSAVPEAATRCPHCTSDLNG